MAFWQGLGLDVLGGLTGALGGALSYKGAKQANRINKQLARERMQFEAGQAREQMGFQERMSNTAYQRAMQDMRMAGLNPILAFNQGGASTPSGAMGSGAQAQMVNEYSGAVSSAIDARRAAAEIKNLAEQNKNIKSSTVLNNALAQQAVANTGKTSADTVKTWASVATTAKDLLPFLLFLLRRGM